jgi:Mce-associated membrane protein
MSLDSDISVDDLQQCKADDQQSIPNAGETGVATVASDCAPTADTDTDQPPPDLPVGTVEKRRRWAGRLLSRLRSTSMSSRIAGALGVIFALGAGWLGWQDISDQQARTAATQSVQAAIESTIAVLSYHPDSAEQELGKARDRLTGSFRKDYEKLTKDVVIPGAKQKGISATARIPAAASVSANRHHAVVLVFVDQTTVVSGGAPTDTASSVRITLDKVDDRWLISAFEPI